LLLAAAVFLVSFILGIAVFIALVAALPERYFVDEHGLWTGKHPVICLLGRIGKNLLGVVLIVLGILLSIPGIPGQGLLTIVVGVVLLDIPGKHHLVKRVMHRPGVLRALNRLRAFFRRPPLVV